MSENLIGFAWNAQDFMPLMEGRSRFLRAVSDAVPAVVRELAELPEAGLVGVPFQTDWRGTMELSFGCLPIETATGLMEWTERRGLADGWARTAMALARADWARERPEQLRLPTASWLGLGDAFATVQEGMASELAQPGPVVEVPPWNMLAPWSAYEEKMLEDVRRQLREYKKACEDRAKSAGWRPAPEKRPRRGGSVNQHFTWLALFQCAGWSYERIANERPKGQTAKAVEKACRDTAALIGLTRRSLPPPEPKFPPLR